MTLALICSQADLTSDLGQTLLWRAGVERHHATRVEEAHVMALAARPDIVVVDRELPRAERLVAALREDSSTRGLSIAVLARGDFEPGEVELLEAGAYALLRLPPGPEWGERLQALMSVPVRAQARLPVRLRVMALQMAGVPWSGIGLNLSRNGMLVETDAELRVGDELELEFALVEDGSTLRTEGRVVRLAGPRQVGVLFPELSSEVRAHIESFVETGHTA